MITDKTLIDALRLLTPAERRAILACVRTGAATPASAAALRRIRFALKRRARSKPPAKMKWLN